MGGSSPANSSSSAPSRLRVNEVSRSRQVELPADANVADPDRVIDLSKVCKQFGTDAIVQCFDRRRSPGVARRMAVDHRSVRLGKINVAEYPWLSRPAHRRAVSF